MLSRSLAAAMIFGSCTAAAGGSYVALRHNAAAPESAPAAVAPVAVQTTAVELPAPIEHPALQVAPQPIARPRPAARRAPVAPSPRTVPVTPVAAEPSPPAEAPAPVATAEPATPAPGQPVADVTTAAVEQPEPEAAFYELVVPASAVIGLEIENTISSEQAKVEDRVDARVTRDVFADGRLAIPAGSRVIGAVTVVERGGKLKDRARLGVRFHTLVLAGGRQVPLRTEAVYREGDSPGNESTKKIGGAAIGGAVLGAILGGTKGAVTGAGVGAAGGTAAVMAGGRNPAVLAGGSVLTVRLSSPVTVAVERQ